MPTVENDSLILALTRATCGLGHPHVTEVYSPPRVTSMAARLGMIPGMSFDLTTVDPDDGKPWDFNDPGKRNKAKRYLRFNKP